MHIAPEEDFDRELELQELLVKVDEKKLTQALVAIVGTNVRLVDVTREYIIGVQHTFNDCQRIPISVELEPVAYLEAQGKKEHIEAVAFFVQQILKGATRYHMASKLHIEAVYGDYEKLQEKHNALQESEARYKDLAENLELRVEQQVKTINATQRQLYQAEKMASVGQLAAGVAHEINNPIGFVKSNLSSAHSYMQKLLAFCQQYKNGAEQKILQSIWEEQDLDFILEDFQVLMQESIDGIERVATIVSDLKKFSNVDNSEEELVDINQHIRSLCNVVTGQLSAKAELKMELTELPDIKCRPGHLNQAIINLVINAADAMDAPGEIILRTEKSGDDIRIQVIDNGRGIPADVIDKIFDPFFTTQDVGQGTGLGLTVTRDIIIAHNGHIDIDSQPGIGTTITMNIPIRK